MSSKSTRSMILLYEVRRWILSSPTQNSPFRLAKTNFVITPVKEEINRTVQSPLEHCPPPTSQNTSKVWCLCFREMFLRLQALGSLIWQENPWKRAYRYKKLCTLMKLPPPKVAKNYSRTSSVITSCLRSKAWAKQMRKSEIWRSKIILLELNSCQCGVSCDGTWQKRGFSSRNRCVTVISIHTGKVLDVEALRARHVSNLSCMDI